MAKWTAGLLVHMYLVATASAGVQWDTVTFDTPTVEPGVNIGGLPIISGGMPIGNGETTALVFPLVEPLEQNGFRLDPGVHMWLGMTTAMASDMSLMPLGVVSIVTNPPLGTGSFSQTLHLQNASVKVSTDKGSVEVWIDALTNKVTARVSSRLAMDATVSIKSLRPPHRFMFGGRCSNATSEADEFLTDGARAHSIGLSHRNLDEDIALLNVPAAFNATLQQQGLGAYIDKLQAGDRWRHRQFGFQASARGFAFRNISTLVAHGIKRAEVTITTLSAQMSSSAAWQLELARRHKRHVEDGSPKDHLSFWDKFWEKSHIWVSSRNSSNMGHLDDLTQRYAQTRYIQAIQAGTWVPIKFNGMTFVSQLPPDSPTSGPDFRQWGSSNWWQNTRLAYWNMAAAGDFSQLRTIFDYYLQMLPFLETRTNAAFNHSGIYVTETKTLFGAYDPCDYGTSASNRSASDVNFGYEESRWLKFDFGGDAGLPELCVMLLDYYAYTLDNEALRRYMPLLTGTLDFFAKHYGDVEQISGPDQELKIFPAQALETYQCPIWPATADNCPTNDHPTLAALHVLTERAQELPEQFSTKGQRAQWLALAKALPAIPMTTEDGVDVVSPYETFEQKSTQHISNTETPELYSTHPFRYFTLGRSLQQGERKRNIAPSIYCLETSQRKSCRHADQNSGWVQGLLNAALLGRAKKAATDTLARAQTPPAKGYRFPAFAPHEQDYEPSEDHFANMATALQLMLLGPADDGLSNGGALLFPAWPCRWDVDFKLRAPRNTIVSGKFVQGKLLELVVTPRERTSAIEVLPCQDVIIGK